MSPAQIQFEDLPARMRRQLGGLNAPSPPARQRAREEPRARWRCHSCLELFTAWAPAERHADAHRHRRIEFDLRRLP